MTGLIDKIIFAVKILNDYFFPITPDVLIPSAITLGNSGASFTIAPNQINKESIIYSFGVGFDISFDLALIEKYDSTIYAFDPTPRSADWINQQKLPKQFIFEDIGVAAHDGLVEFFPPENPDYISHTIVSGTRTKADSFSVKVEQLSTIMKRLHHDKIDLLKMDIEGAEYVVIDDLLRENLSIRQIVVEFHHRFKGFKILETRHAVKKLRNAGYKLFSVSTNNEEFSFIKEGVN
ncbi:MAG: FkbM family methyltransferase [Candidatus Yonathbacteria bacterium CG_4_10_14_3_um_filter_43_12]|uniref:FkbM family methyltransferase n=1 Tax=Candidatus Yonathbacteria bacterium CG_4_10_14_0_8_um_filter_43_17 TaxID=1975099 RepID=A0A2M7Q5T6_9BACT|nr:MAG: FkbM family methyltransferase [Candidatus Yonathbacteria bacterium CG_4_10_14_3_um_filter_43_12]PIY58806.1 MAG: FkbM family methyltransferase [Candidatus Yonathbacteria bacterium CG_4_10_14_0_8_um_filter_43_17]